MEDLHMQRNHRRRSEGRAGMGGPGCQREALLVLITGGRGGTCGGLATPVIVRRSLELIGRA